MHTLYTAVDKSLHRTRYDQIKITHDFFICWIHLDLMNTLHMNTEYFPVFLSTSLKRLKLLKSLISNDFYLFVYFTLVLCVGLFTTNLLDNATFLFNFVSSTCKYLIFISHFNDL